jgi:RNA polymerase sigma factor (sigma-70 family)
MGAGLLLCVASLGLDQVLVGGFQFLGLGTGLTVTTRYCEGRASRWRLRERSVPRERRERADEDLVRLYLNEVGRYALLTRDDEARLAQVIEAGRAAQDRVGTSVDEDNPLSTTEQRELRHQAQVGKDAAEEFLKANLRLVVSIAKRYQASGVPLLDLIQDGNLGLLRAVEKFDWRRGLKFSTYASWWIREAIIRGIVNTGRTIRLPVHISERLIRLQRAISQLEVTLGRPPTRPELAAELGLSQEKVVQALGYAAEPLSLSDPRREGAELGDFVEDCSAPSPVEAAESALLVRETTKLLDPLNDREREILRLRFGLDRGEPRTLKEVGQHFRLSHERIRQIEAKAMSKLRHPSLNGGVREFLAP